MDAKRWFCTTELLFVGRAKWRTYVKLFVFPSRRTNALQAWSVCCTICSKKTSSYRPTAFAPCPRSTRKSRTPSKRATKSTRSITCLASPTLICSVATPTGVVLFGSLSTVCSLKLCTNSRGTSFQWTILALTDTCHYCRYYGDKLQVEYPTGSGVKMGLEECAVSAGYI